MIVGDEVFDGTHGGELLCDLLDAEGGNDLAVAVVTAAAEDLIALGELDGAGEAWTDFARTGCLGVLDAIIVAFNWVDLAVF